MKWTGKYDSLQIDSPCMDCPDRVVEPNCHDSCERFAEFKVEREKIKDSMREVGRLTRARRRPVKVKRNSLDLRL